MPKRADLTGRRFGRFIAIKIVGRNKWGMPRWLCKCDCGGQREVLHGALLAGRTKKCRCLSARKFHGMARTPTYSCWGSMISRCNNPRQVGFKYWGGRGITVCERWRNFENFLADMGERPDGMTIERIDNNGNYEPSNCRWATYTEQNRNRRGTKIIEYGGKQMPISAWADTVGISRRVIAQRIRCGWAVADALTRPVRVWPAKENHAVT